MKRFVRGDLDGFFGLALDNLILLLVLSALCRYVLGFPDALIAGRILPGAAVSLLVGNLYYAHQARRLARDTARDDVCALPYGLNAVTVFAFVFLVMLPAKLAAQAAGAADPARVAWQAGLLACFSCGVIEFAASFIVERIRRATPRAALLSTLAGLALAFISLGFLFRAYANPVVGLTTLGVILLGYFGRVRFRGGLPVGLVAVALGTALAWGTGLAPSGPPPGAPSLHLPLPVIGDLIASFRADFVVSYFAIVVPMGLFIVAGSMQNLESAEAAGDRYPSRPSLAVNGLGSIAAAVFGSCFPTTLYIGHPGWKAMGARAGYSSASGVFLALLCFTGTLAHVAWLIPVEAGMAILLWIGIVMSAQAFQATPAQHAPAVVIGILPGLATWGALMAKAGLHVAGLGLPGGAAFSAELLPKFLQSDVHIAGAFALEQGVVFTAMILSAMTVAIIERRFNTAATWCGIAALLSATGLMHGYQYAFGDTVLALRPAWPYVSGYALMALLFVGARWLTLPQDGVHGSH
ncbi:permease [Solimonas soli]|uniref:permease n=1 Tax=Solimonas soli TaxID=413479 RepID=UPI0004B105D0|nr:permease [Solimonas soli]